MESTTNQNKIKDFKDLRAWQEGHSLVLLIYKTTKQFPKEETYSLTDQMRRAASSVTANIAEGFGRQGYKEKVQFYHIAQGSLIELKNSILISKDVGYLNNSDFNKLETQADIVHRILQGLLTKTKLFLNRKS